EDQKRIHRGVHGEVTEPALPRALLPYRDALDRSRRAHGARSASLHHFTRSPLDKRSRNANLTANLDQVVERQCRAILLGALDRTRENSFDLCFCEARRV